MAVRATTWSGSRATRSPGAALLVHGGSMAVSPDGTKLAFTSATQQQDGQSCRTRSPSSTCAPARAAHGGSACPSRARRSRSRASPGPRTDARWSSARCGGRPYRTPTSAWTTPAGRVTAAPRFRSLDVENQGRNARSRQHPRLSQSARYPVIGGRGRRPGADSSGRAVRPPRRRDPHRRTRRRRREAGLGDGGYDRSTRPRAPAGRRPTVPRPVRRSMSQQPRAASRRRRRVRR